MNANGLPKRLMLRPACLVMLILGVAVQSLAAVPPAGSNGFGSSSSFGNGFGAIVSRVPPATGTGFSSSPISTPSAGSVYLGLHNGTSTATGGLPGPTIGPTTNSFQGEGSALGAFNGNFPGQVGLGGDFRGPAGGAGMVPSAENPAPMTPMPGTPTMSADFNGGPFVGPRAIVTNRPVIGPVTSASQSANANTANARGQSNDWRYVNFNGRLWYWTPNNQWLYYQNGAWQTFQLPTAPAGSSVPYSAGANGGAAPGTNAAVR
jgi:hypothetical protein